MSKEWMRAGGVDPDQLTASGFEYIEYQPTEDGVRIRAPWNVELNPFGLRHVETGDPVVPISGREITRLSVLFSDKKPKYPVEGVFGVDVTLDDGVVVLMRPQIERVSAQFTTWPDDKFDSSLAHLEVLCMVNGVSYGVWDTGEIGPLTSQGFQVGMKREDAELATLFGRKSVDVLEIPHYQVMDFALVGLVSDDSVFGERPLLPEQYYELQNRRMLG